MADVLGKSYHTQLIATEDIDGTAKTARAGDCGFLKPHIFTLTIPQVTNYLIEQTLKFLLCVSTLSYLLSKFIWFDSFSTKIFFSYLPRLMGVPIYQ